jgi:hypothetical protein
LGLAAVSVLARFLGLSWAGIFAGPTAWAVNTQLGYALVPWVCASEVNIIPLLAVIMALLALAGAWVSWLAMPRAELDSGGSHAGGEPRGMLAGVGVASGLLFALLILMQGAAGVVFDGCER